MESKISARVRVIKMYPKTDVYQAEDVIEGNMYLLVGSTLRAELGIHKSDAKDALGMTLQIHAERTQTYNVLMAKPVRPPRG